MTRQVMMTCMNNDMTMYEYSKFMIVQYMYMNPQPATCSLEQITA